MRALLQANGLGFSIVPMRKCYAGIGQLLSSTGNIWVLGAKDIFRSGKFTFEERFGLT